MNACIYKYAGKHIYACVLMGVLRRPFCSSHYSMSKSFVLRFTKLVQPTPSCWAAAMPGGGCKGRGRASSPPSATARSRRQWSLWLTLAPVPGRGSPCPLPPPGDFFPLLLAVGCPEHQLWVLHASGGMIIWKSSGRGSRIRKSCYVGSEIENQ